MSNASKRLVVNKNEKEKEKNLRELPHCRPSLPLSSPVLRRSPSSLVVSEDFVVTSSGSFVPLSVSLCSSLTVVD